MIQLNCTNCKSLLQIDDAFAGGVCRCRYCGTIQTVPKRLKKASVGSDSGAAGEVEASANGGTSSAKTLFTKKGGVETAGSGTGLDDLAGIVASSGLTSGRLQKKAPPPAAPEVPPSPWDRRTIILLSSAGGVIALLLIVILVMAFRDRSGGTVAISDQGPGQTPPMMEGGPPSPPAIPVNTSPNFLGQPIDAGIVAYVLDRGNYSHESHRLESLKTALVNSVKSLGPNRKFQVVFWEITGDAPKAYPPEGTHLANAEGINELKAFLEDIYSVGTTQEVSALHLALKSKPQAVMFVPIRGLAEEQQTLATRVLRERAGENAQTTKIDCFTLGQTEWAPAMRQISDSTGGKYRDVPLDELNKFANP